MARAAKKAAKKAAKPKTNVIKQAADTIKNTMGIGSKDKKEKGTGRGRRRSKSPAYWANKVLVQKLKSKYYKMKYRGV